MRFFKYTQIFYIHHHSSKSIDDLRLFSLKIHALLIHNPSFLIFNLSQIFNKSFNSSILRPKTYALCIIYIKPKNMINHLHLKNHKTYFKLFRYLVESFPLAQESFQVLESGPRSGFYARPRKKIFFVTKSCESK